MAVSRLRLKDVLETTLPDTIGICVSDRGMFAGAINRAQERLLTCPEAGDTGWYGGYAEIALNSTQNNPFITLPRGVARVIKLDVCNVPMRLENQFYEYLDFGSGKWPRLNCNPAITCHGGPFKGYRRNTVPTFSDIATPNKGLRIYLGNVSDVGKRVFVSGTDSNGQTLYSLSDGVSARGLFASLASPFVDLSLQGTSVAVQLGSITNIQKDVTLGPVRFYELDLTTGAQRLLLTMEPSEKIAAYTRYYLNALPDGCCVDPSITPGENTVTLSAMVKLDLIPVVLDSDYLLIQHKEALVAEAQAARLSDMDSDSAKAQSKFLHREAVRYLQGQLVHYEGKENPAINFAPFGSAKLQNQAIGLLV